MANETAKQTEDRLRGEAILAKLTSQQRGILESLREEGGKISTTKFYADTKAEAVALLVGLKAHGVVEYIPDNQEYVITEEGWHVAMAGLNAALKAYNESDA